MFRFFVGMDDQKPWTRRHTWHTSQDTSTSTSQPPFPPTKPPWWISGRKPHHDGWWPEICINLSVTYDSILYILNLHPSEVWTSINIWFHTLQHHWLNLHMNNSYMSCNTSRRPGSRDPWGSVSPGWGSKRMGGDSSMVQQELRCAHPAGPGPGPVMDPWDDHGMITGMNGTYPLVN